jgi:RNA polymerase sigma factor (sigma-70 family)
MTGIKTSKTTSEAANPRLPDIDGAALIRRAQAGDNDAYGVLWNHYRPIVAGQVRLLLDSNNDFEDLVQEIGIKAWKAIGGFRGESKFSSWLYRIVSNHCYTYLKRFSRKAAKTDSIEELEERQEPIKGLELRGSAEDSLARREKWEMTQLLYKKLKVRDQRIFEMIVGEHKDVDEVVAKLGEKHGHVLYVLGHFVERLEDAVSAHSSRKSPVVRAKVKEDSCPERKGAVGLESDR